MKMITTGAMAIAEKGWKGVIAAIIIGIVALRALTIIGADVMEKSAVAISSVFEPLKMFMAGLSGMVTMAIIGIGIAGIVILIAKIKN